MNLINAAEMQREHPETFGRPPDADLATIGRGDIVKVCDGGERFWVQISARKGDILTGKVKSLLVFSSLEFDQEIRFCIDNVYEVENSVLTKNKAA